MEEDVPRIALGISTGIRKEDNFTKFVIKTQYCSLRRHAINLHPTQ